MSSRDRYLGRWTLPPQHAARSGRALGPRVPQTRASYLRGSSTAERRALNPSIGVQLLAALVLAAALGACGDSEPPPEPPPPVCNELPECANSGGTWDPLACDCECSGTDVFVEDRGCVPVPEPPPVIACGCTANDDIQCSDPFRAPTEGAAGNCYLTRERAGWLPVVNPGGSFSDKGNGEAARLWFDDQQLVWDGARNLRYVWAFDECREALPEAFGVPADFDLHEFWTRGFLLHDGGLELGGPNGSVPEAERYRRRNAVHFMGTLTTEHPTHEGRVRTYRFAYRDFRNELDAHLSIAEQLNGARSWCNDLRGN